MPIGNQTSQCFALYYLDVLDRIIKEKYQIKFYSRYVDDGILICNDKKKLQTIIKEIIKTCDKLELSINKKKTRIYKLSNGFTYLGFRFLLLDNGKIIMKIPNKKKKRIIRYIKALNNYMFYKKM